VHLTQRPPVWRSRFLAPVYAALVTFGLIALATPVVGAQVDLTVAVTAAEQLSGVQIQVRDANGHPVDPETTKKPDRAGRWSGSVPAGDLSVCVLADQPLRLADPPSEACVSAQATSTTSITVEAVQVIAHGPGDSPAEGATVSGVDAAGTSFDIGALDAAGRLTLPHPPPKDGKVCLAPPQGWKVLAPPRGADGRFCRKVGDQYADVVFEVAQS
jgi:hypothetical protein